MAANTMSFTQISSILNDLHQQVTGQTAQAVVDTASFIAVATTTMQAGFEPVNKAISQMMSRTIFSERPYFGKYKGLMLTPTEWGNWVRKISFGDSPAVDADAYELTDGESIDQQIVHIGRILQTNFYGTDVWDDVQTVTRQQLKCAFMSPQELQSFLVAQMRSVFDKMEQRRETTARMTICNLIGGTIKAANEPQVVHLITEYNALTGKSLTAGTYMAPENYPDFIRWVCGRIMTASDKLTDRLTMYHTNVTDTPISRHTPKEMQHLYILSQDANSMAAQVMSTTYHDQLLNFGSYERLNFWQSPDKPDTINIKASYMGTDGTIKTDSTGTETSGIFGVLFDRDAAGVTPVDQSTDVAPYNARGRYQNTFWHYGYRYHNDFTENCVVFLLD